MKALEGPSFRAEAPHLRRLIAAWAEALRAAGVRESEPVLVEGEATPQAIIAGLAVREAGASLCFLHPSLPDAPRSRLAMRSGARLMIGKAPAANGLVGTPVGNEPTKIPDLSGKPSALPTEFLVFTSGSEGEPKGVLLSEAGFRAHRDAARGRLEPGPGERWLLGLSPAHVGGLALILRWRDEAGAALVCPQRAWTHRIDATVRAGGITHVPLVPTQLRRWLDEARAAPPGLRLVLVGGAACPPELLARAKRAGFPVRLTYGLTEAHSQVATALPGTPAGSAGPPLSGVEVRTDASTGRIEVRGPTLMRGYLGKPLVLAGAWFATGDAGSVDGRGNLWIRGRLDDVIITGGRKVDPSAVEAALGALPGVAEACVVGVPDPEWGERVVALVVPRAGAASDAATWRAALQGSLAPHEVPKEFRVVQALPHTPTGKLRRRDARSLLDEADVRVHEPAH